VAKTTICCWLRPTTASKTTTTTTFFVSKARLGLECVMLQKAEK